MHHLMTLPRASDEIVRPIVKRELQRVFGASDAVSIVVRFSLVQIETPDEKRGRVSAINYLFVGSSNTLGEFESGLVAAWLGAVPSVVIGGLGSLLVAGIWMLMFPDLRRIDRYEPADREQVRA